MINILPELIYKERQLSDFDFHYYWSIDMCFYRLLERIREHVDKDNKSYEQEYCSMFNTAYYLTTVILNSEDPEQYFDEYLKVASGERVVFMQGTIFSSDIRRTCIMQMVYWLINGIDPMRPCERRLQERLSEWLAPQIALLKIFVKEFPRPGMMVYNRNYYPLRPLTPDVLKGIDWGKLTLTDLFDADLNDLNDMLFNVGKNALEKLLLTDSILHYIKQKLSGPKEQSGNYYGAKLHLTVVKRHQLDLFPELQSLVEPEEEEPESCPHPKVINFVMKLADPRILTIGVDEYRKLWDNLLAIKEVEAELYKTGRQGFKDFNSYLIAGIIYEIKSKVFKPDANDSDLVRKLDEKNGYDSRLRKRLGKPYQSEGMDAARKFIGKWKEEKFGKN